MRGHSAAIHTTDATPADVPTAADDPAAPAAAPEVSCPDLVSEAADDCPDLVLEAEDDFLRQDSDAPAVSAAHQDLAWTAAAGCHSLLPDDSLPANHRQVPDASEDSAESPHNPKEKNRTHTRATRSVETASILLSTENTVGASLDDPLLEGKIKLTQSFSSIQPRYLSPTK
jgi:hypothetical protein